MPSGSNVTDSRSVRSRIEAGLPECLTHTRQGLLQAVACLRLGAVTPEQAGKALAGLRLSGRQRQIGEQQPVLAGRQGQLPAVPRPRAKPPNRVSLHATKEDPPAGEPYPRRRRFYPLFTLAIPPSG